MTQQEIVTNILTQDWTPDGVSLILDALKLKNYIVSAVRTQTNESETLEHFLERFWDYDKSPYVHEKRIVGQSIHRRYTDIMLSRARTYWIPRMGNRPLGQITKEDIKRVMWQLATQKQNVFSRKKNADGSRKKTAQVLSAETVNQVVRSATCALKWAFQNGLTPNDCFSGLIYCHVTPQKRHIPTLSDVKRIFGIHWNDSASRLANLTAMCTGMRIGEIQALQLGDIGSDRIYVRHNWARRDGLKTPKNGEAREILITPELHHMLIRQGMKNPFGTSPGDFIFFGQTRKKPRSAQFWNKALKEVTRSLGIKNASNITFHCWRHFFTACMADFVDGRKLQLATGHKTMQMLEHYAAHQSEQTLEELGDVSKQLFLDIIRLPIA